MVPQILHMKEANCINNNIIAYPLLDNLGNNYSFHMESKCSVIELWIQFQRFSKNPLRVQHRICIILLPDKIWMPSLPLM